MGMSAGAFRLVESDLESSIVGVAHSPSQHELTPSPGGAFHRKAKIFKPN
jgi:hypothetical protein